MRQPLILLLISILFLSCKQEKKPQIEITQISSPSLSNSLTPRLFTAADGSIYLSWLERQDKNTQFKFSKLKNSEWSQAKTISEGSDWFVNWADFPSFIANQNSLSAHWLQKRAEGTYDYDIHVSQSIDNGNTWSESFIPHNDGIAAEHGFVSMTPLTNHKNFITWLDGRNTKSKPASQGHNGHHGNGAMTIRAGIFNTSGEMIKDWELDERTCDCCQTTAAITSNGPVVAYRDRSEDEIRDIYITRLEDSVWTQPKAVFHDNWKISGCPVNGPSIAAQGSLVAIAWFTAAQGFGEVKLSTSVDAAKTFSSPIVISKGNTNGRVGVTILDTGNVAMSWMEINNEEASIMLAIFDSNGNEIKRQLVAQTSAARASGFPVISSNKNDLVMAWTETGDQSYVKSAFITLHDF